tara:strand:- start:266 stop:670 length:405 start_codon:yes stop_codon:yes gene_type:complete
MARPPLYDEETIARVEAALIAGQTPTVVSRLYGLPRTTVLKIRGRMSTTVTKEPEVCDASQTVTKPKGPAVSLDDLLASVLEDNLKALQVIARTTQSERYVNGQSAAQIAALYEKIATFSVQLLSAASEGPDEN